MRILRAVVDPRLLCLFVLILARDAVEPPAFFKQRAGLFEGERNLVQHTLAPELQHPVVTADTRAASGFAAYNHFADPFAQKRRQVNWAEQRFADDAFVPYPRPAVEREPVIRAVLVFHRTADLHVFVPVAPVIRDAGVKPVDPLGDEEKVKVAPLSNHLPRFLPPFVRVLHKKVGGKAGIDQFSGRDLVASVPLPAYRQVEIRGFLHNRTVPPMLLIVKPGGAAFSDIVPALAGVIGALGAGVAYTAVRYLTLHGERGTFIVFFFSAFSCLSMLPFLLFDFHPMSLEQLGFLLLAGLAAAGGQFSVTAAYSFAPAREISVFDYTQVIFAALMGFFLFGQVPDLLSFAGYVVICGVSVVMFLYNRRGQTGQ